MSCDENRESSNFKYPFCGRVTRMGPFFGTDWSHEYALNHFSAQIVYLLHSRLLTPFLFFVFPN
jgi:hypothetical protein